MNIAALLVAWSLSGQTLAPPSTFVPSGTPTPVGSAALPTSPFGTPTPAEGPTPAEEPATADDLPSVTVKDNFQRRSESNDADVQTLSTDDGESQVQPATTIQPLTPMARAPGSDVGARSLLAEALNPENFGGANNPLTLAEAISRHTDRASQLAAIKAYWEATSLMADLAFTRDEMRRLEELPAPSAAVDQANHAAVIAAWAARLNEAELAAATAQYMLADAALIPSSHGPPLPVDRPFVGGYRTSYNELFSGRPAPVGMLRIDRTLPMRKGLIDARAEAAASALRAVQAEVEGYQAGRRGFDGVRQAIDRLRTQRGAFLGAIRDYNLDICEYALATAQPSDPPQKIVSMLIETEAQTASVLVSPPASVVSQNFGSVQQASAEPPLMRQPRFGPETGVSQQPAVITQQNVSPAATFIPSTPVIARPTLGFPTPAGGAAVGGSQFSNEQMNPPKPTTSRVVAPFQEVPQDRTAADLRPRSSFSASPDEAPTLPPR